MDTLQTYLLERLKLADAKLAELNDIQLSLIKFYFTTIFSIGTIVVTLYSILGKTDVIVPWLLLLPLLFFGIVIFYSLKKLFIEYERWERTREQAEEIIVHGEKKNTFQLFGTPFSAFSNLILCMIVINIVAFIYTVFPFLKSKLSWIIIVIIVAVLFTGIMASIVLASLNVARKKGRDAQRKAELANLRAVLELYYDENDSYPITEDFNQLNSLLKKYTNREIADPLNIGAYKYSYSSDGKSYILKCNLENGGEWVINSGNIQ